MNIIVQRGQSVNWRLSLAQNGSPVDLTGGTWEVLEPLSKPTITITVTDATNGESYLRIDKDQTKGLALGAKKIRPRFVFPDGSAIAMTPISYEVR